MNENSTAGAVFFALMSIGALIKSDEVVGIGVGVLCAIISAFFVKKSIMQAAMEQEENHQRLEIQFQQLRHKLGDGGSSDEDIIRAITNGSDRLEEELQVIRDKLDRLDSLMEIAESNKEIKTAISALAESSQAVQKMLQKVAENSEAEIKLLKVTVEKMSGFEEKFTTLEENSKKLNELTESSQTTVQTGLKLMQVIGQMLKAPPFAKDLTQLSKSMDTLNEKMDKLDKLDSLDNLEKLTVLEDIKISMNETTEKLSDLKDMKDYISESGNSITSSVDNLSEVNKNISEEVSQTNEQVIDLNSNVNKAAIDVTTAIKTMKEDIIKLTTKIDAYNGLMKTAMEQYSTLSEQDVKVLEKIAEKIQ